LCFKGELSIEDFISLITNMYNTADKLGIPLDRFPAYITELKDRIDDLSRKARCAQGLQYDLRITSRI
jgi:hypothetical protein